MTMRAALKKCLERFREYEQNHLAKGTEDGNAKAKRNAEMVALCEEALMPPAEPSEWPSITPTEWEVIWLDGRKDDPFIRASNHWVQNIGGMSFRREILSDEVYPEKLADAYMAAAAPRMYAVLRALAAGSLLDRKRADMVQEVLHLAEGVDQ